MNEPVMLVLAGGRGPCARRDLFRRPLVDGAQGSLSVETAGALVLGSLLVRMASPWPDFICFGRSLGAAAGLSARIRHRAFHRDAASPGRRPNTNRPAKEAAMRLSPDEIIFWQHGFVQTQRHHCVHLGTDARAGRRFKTHHAQLSTGLKRSRWQNLLEIVVTGSRNKSKKWASATRGSISLSGHALPVRRLAASAPSFPATSRRRIALDHGGAGAVRVCGRAAVRHRERGWAATSSPM
jgi:hypothetical protein